MTRTRAQRTPYVIMLENTSNTCKTSENILTERKRIEFQVEMPLTEFIFHHQNTRNRRMADSYSHYQLLNRDVRNQKTALLGL